VCACVAQMKWKKAFVKDLGSWDTLYWRFARYNGLNKWTGVRYGEINQNGRSRANTREPNTKSKHVLRRNDEQTHMAARERPSRTVCLYHIIDKGEPGLMSVCAFACRCVCNLRAARLSLNLWVRAARLKHTSQTQERCWFFVSLPKTSTFKNTKL